MGGDWNRRQATAIVCAIIVGGLAFGAVFGLYCSRKTVPPTKWSRHYWAIFGLIGALIPIFITVVIFYGL